MEQTKTAGDLTPHRAPAHPLIPTTSPDHNQLADEFDWEEFAELDALLEMWDGIVVRCGHCGGLNVEVNVYGQFELLLQPCSQTTEELESLAAKYLHGGSLANRRSKSEYYNSW